MKRSHKEDSRLYDLRCTICCAVLVLIAAIGPLHAQDVLPGSLSCHVGGTDCDTLCLYSQRTDTVSVPFDNFSRRIPANEGECTYRQSGYS